MVDITQTHAGVLQGLYRGHDEVAGKGRLSPVVSTEGGVVAAPKRVGAMIPALLGVRWLGIGRSKPSVGFPRRWFVWIHLKGGQGLAH
jgi:hypothetical protein